MMPPSISETDEKHNKRLLLQRVNEPDAFDVDLKPSDRDRLQVSIRCGPYADNSVDYGFEYRNGKWVEEEFDSLEWMWHHDITAFGSIKNALQKA